MTSPLTRVSVWGGHSGWGYPRPGRTEALKWYADTRSQSGNAATAPARCVGRAVLLGAIGCVAVYGLGPLAFDGRVGGTRGTLPDDQTRSIGSTPDRACPTSSPRA